MAYRPTEKTMARKAEIRQKLLDAALALVSQGGFSALTILAVAAEAGIATGAVYKHFESKAQLCAEVFRIATEREVAVVRQTALGAGSPSERLLHLRYPADLAQWYPTTATLAQALSATPPPAARSSRS